MQTGENEQALRQIIDMTRMCSIVLLLLHTHYYTHRVLVGWGMSHEFIDRIMLNIVSTGLFKTIWISKGLSLSLLLVSLLGAHGKKDQDIRLDSSVSLLAIGVTVISVLTLYTFN